jgi:predicted kinase
MMSSMLLSRRLVVICGLSFAGKTTLGNAICTALGHEQVDVDCTKADLYGHNVPDDALGPEDWARIYDETDCRIATCLREGNDVVDASRNFKRRERDRARGVAVAAGANAVVVYIDTPEALCRKRWLENRQTRARRDVSDQGFEELVTTMEPPRPEENALVFHYSDDVRRWLLDHALELKGPGRSTAEQRAAPGRRARGG